MIKRGVTVIAIDDMHIKKLSKNNQSCTVKTCFKGAVMIKQLVNLQSKKEIEVQ